MGSKKKNTTGTSDGNLSQLKIGSRVRCTDDGVTGRLVLANGVVVKIRWDDGEQVTWKRDSLATRPLEILDGDGDDQTPPAAATDAAARISETTEAEENATRAAEPTTTTEQVEETTTTAPESSATAPEPTATEPLQEPTAPTTELAATEEATTEQATAELGTEATEPTVGQTGNSTEPEQSTARPKRQRKTPAEPQQKKVSALDAAARVLAEEGRPMTCKEMIEAMALKGYWTSPGGQTPGATLYSAILRELATKGEKSRFRKVGRGQFAYHAAQ